MNYTGRRSKIARFTLLVKCLFVEQNVSQKTPFWESNWLQKCSKTCLENSVDFWLAFWTFFGAFWLHFGVQKWQDAGRIFTQTGPCDARGGRLDHLGVILVSISSKMMISVILGAQIIVKNTYF